jgi:hypothetical protein
MPTTNEPCARCGTPTHDDDFTRFDATRGQWGWVATVATVAGVRW